MKYYLGICISIKVVILFQVCLCGENVKDIVPENYLLTIEPYFSNMSFRGQMSIKFSVINATTQIILKAEQLKCEEVLLKSLHTSKTMEIRVGFFETNNDWIFSTTEQLLGKYILNFTFHGGFSNVKDDEGLFYNTYIDDESEKMYTVFDSWRRKSSGLYPKFDLPFSKTPFTAVIARSPVNFSLSNLKLQETSHEKGPTEEKLWDTYYSPNISAHQVVFIFHELCNVTNANFTMFTKCDSLVQTNFSLSLLKIIIEYVDKWFPHQMITHLDVIALPDGPPHMKVYPGLVLCRVMILRNKILELLTEIVQNARVDVGFFCVLAVTRYEMEDQILLIETISNSKSQRKVEEYSVYIIVKHLLAKLESEETDFFEGLAIYLKEKILSQMDFETKNNNYSYMYEETENNYYNSTLSFHKKVSDVLRFIDGTFLPGETVMKVFSRLLNESNPVTIDNFFSTLTQLMEESNNSPKHSNIRLMRAWMIQQGWPVVTVTLDKSSINITQKSSTGSNMTWPIPLRFKCDRDFMNHENDFHEVWLLEPYQEVPLTYSCQWAIFHSDGLYRVNYNSSIWQRLADILILNYTTIPVYARSQLIDDIFHLAEEKLVNYSEVFHLTNYLVNETDYWPWKFAAFNFEKLMKLFHGTQLSLDIQNYVKTLYLPYFEKVYRIKQINETRSKRIATSDALFWGCHWGLDSCLQFTTELFKQWKSLSKRFPPDYKQAALCTGVRQFPEVFMEVFDAYTESQVEGDRLVFLKALACTKNLKNINYLLELVFLDEGQMMIGHHNKLQLIEYLVEYPDNLRSLVSFLEKNYHTASIVVGLNMLNSVWSTIERNTYSQEIIYLITTMAVNSSLPLSLKERLRTMLVNADTGLKKITELSPLVSAGLSNYWTQDSSIGSSHLSFHPSFLTVTLLLFIHFTL